MNTFWKKQTKNKPLYSDLAWDKPENKKHAGKLLIIGGNTHEFSAPGQSYEIAEKSGIGVAKVLLPDALQKSVGRILENGEYAPSNKSGSFAKNALDSWLQWADWADGVLIAGDLGRNSETAIVLEKFISNCSKPLVITKDAIDYFRANALTVAKRPSTVLVLSLSQLQKFCIEIGWTTPVTYSMGLAQLVELLHNLTDTYPASFVTVHNDVYFVAHKGMVSTTNSEIPETWRVPTSASSAVWLIQNQNRPFEALTSAVIYKI
jgi:hypothetical protein